jgi:hypothetical protein
LPTNFERDHFAPLGYRGVLNCSGNDGISKCAKTMQILYCVQEDSAVTRSDDRGVELMNELSPLRYNQNAVSLCAYERTMKQF